MADFITGAVNAYYATEEDAQLGLAGLNEEVYARRTPDGWSVYRLCCAPVLPEGVRLPPALAVLFATLAGQMEAPGDAHQTIAARVSQKDALDLVRAHEEEPRPCPGLPVLRQRRKPEDSTTHWHRSL